MLRFSLLGLQCDLMRKKRTPTPTQNGKPRRPNTEQLGRSKLTYRDLFRRDLRRKSRKAFFNTWVGTYLGSLEKKQNYLGFGCLLLWFEDGTSNTLQSQKKPHKTPGPFSKLMFIVNMCTPSSNFPKSFSKILQKQGARGTNTRIGDELAAIPDRKFAAKGAEQQLFFFLFF